MTNAETQTSVDLANSPIKLYPSGALISCGNEWELWEYVAPTGDEATGTWAKTA